MESVRFIYQARLERTAADEIVASFRDLPECLTSGRTRTEAIAAAQDALGEAVAGRIDDGEPIPAPTTARPGEYPVTMPADMAAKAAFATAFRNSGLSRVALAKRLGMDEKAVRRMLDPRHGTAPERIDKALHALGGELVIEIRECSSVPAGP